jgi:AcrR family transcriptional regulator
VVVLMAGRARRDVRVSATREALLVAAERLFAEQGVHAVANRQVSAAAGQGNNAAVTYHFGTKTDLVRAIVRKHAEEVEGIRARVIADIGDSADLRDWVACSVRPVTEHLEALGSPTWYARFIAQVTADPALQTLVAEDSMAGSPSLRRMLDGMNRCLPDLPAEVYAERSAMARHLIAQMAVERERALADNTPTFSASWSATATGLIDVLVALWQAPVTTRR